MNSQLLKKIIGFISSENLLALKQISETIILEEKKKGHTKLAKELEQILLSNNKNNSNNSNTKTLEKTFEALPVSKRDNQMLVTKVEYENLKRHMVLSLELEKIFDKIEREYAAKDRLAKYNLKPRTKILLYGPPGCGKTIGAERIAWNLGLPLLKVKFDAIISSYFGESASNLRAVFEASMNQPCVLLLDECDFIAKARNYGQDVGEIPRIVNTLLMLLDEYQAPGILIATTNLENSLDQALFRRFDEVVEMSKPSQVEIKKVFEMTLGAFKVDKKIKWTKISEQVIGDSYSNIVKIAENAAKACILEGKEIITEEYIQIAIKEVKRTK